MPKVNQLITSLRDKVRSYACQQIKSAALGGEQDTPFEQAFSNLAHAYLKDKAPSLLDYEIGFQLLEKNQENTKAVGIFGFKVGNQWLYAPVFFLSGDLKGHELLYIKNEDMFVPLKENWLNYIINRKPGPMGTETTKQLSELGVMAPHLYQLSRSPSKYASHLPKWTKEILPVVGYLVTNNPTNDSKYKDITTLPTFLKKEGKVVIDSLIRGFKENPKLAQAFDDLYGLDIVDNAIEAYKIKETEAQSTSVLKEAVCKNTMNGVRCYERKKPKTTSNSVVSDAPMNDVDNTSPGDLLHKSAYGEPLDKGITYAQQNKLKIYMYDEVMRKGTGLSNLNKKDREKLLKDKVLIKDERGKTVKAYEVTSPVKLQNPNGTGLYEVLVKADKFEKCLIIFAPYSHEERKDFVTLVRVSDGSDSKGRAWLNIHPGHIWVGKQYTNEDFQDWWKKLPEAKEFDESRTGLYVVVGNTGEGSLPFNIEEDLGGDVHKSYNVNFKCYAEKDRPGHLPIVNKSLQRTSMYMERFTGRRIKLTGKRGASLRATGEDLYIPADYKKLTLRPPKDDDFGIMGICGCDAHSDPSPIEPGNQFDIDLLLGTKTASVKIYDTGTEVEIDGNRMQKLAALIHLVRDWGFSENVARTLLKRAAEKKSTRFRIKKSDQSYDLQRSDISAPSMPEPPMGYDSMSGNSIPTQHTGEWNLPIPELSAGLTDRSIYSPIGPEPPYQSPPAPDRQAQQDAIMASQTGQKEIFDTAMIGSLLKAVRDDSMVDKYMGDLMKGLDRLGRILFVFYWHGEKFEERYGKTDIVELEDGLRNSFESLGDVILFLQQNAIDGGSFNDMTAELDHVPV